MGQQTTGSSHHTPEAEGFSRLFPRFEAPNALCNGELYREANRWLRRLRADALPKGMKRNAAENLPMEGILLHRNRLLIKLDVPANLLAVARVPKKSDRDLNPRGIAPVVYSAEAAAGK